jgi:DNA-binding GntR family transcriptional regulator
MTVEMQVKHRNLPDQLADHLVTMIAKGELRPGQRLLEKEICESQNVSRIPVREALRILQAQGVVRTEPNRGSFVTEFTSDEMAELLELRLGVERIALARIMHGGTPRPYVRAEFSDVLRQMHQAALLSDQYLFCQADLAFHRRIVELSQSPVLNPIWQTLSRGVLVFLMRERDVTYDYARSIQEHEELLSLIEAGRRDAVMSEIERHIMSNLRWQRQARRPAVASSEEEASSKEAKASAK